MAISKDESIITQVAAKIAADLTPPNGDVNARIVDWVMAFDAVREAMFAAHGSAPQPQAQPQQVAPNHMNDPVVVVDDVFGAGAVQQPAVGGVQVKGTQHGPLPDWLVAQCAAAGVTTVWDNRDGLAQNPKRPWFKAADGTKNQRGDDMAFWPPRGR